MARADIPGSIKAKLQALDTPKYQGVYIGEPRRISEGNRVIAAWYDEEGERTRTMKNAMLWEHWQIRAYWRYVASADVMEDVEREVWTSKAQIVRNFHADSDLGGDASNMDFADIGTGWVEIGTTQYRVLSLVLRLERLDEEPITP